MEPKRAKACNHMGSRNRSANGRAAHRRRQGDAEERFRSSAGTRIGTAGDCLPGESGRTPGCLAARAQCQAYRVATTFVLGYR